MSPLWIAIFHFKTSRKLQISFSMLEHLTDELKLITLFTVSWRHDSISAVENVKNKENIQVLYRHLSGETKENTKHLIQDSRCLTKIRTEYLQNTSQLCYRYFKPVITCVTAKWNNERYSHHPSYILLPKRFLSNVLSSKNAVCKLVIRATFVHPQFSRCN
jgi:hypothetical protein